MKANGRTEALTNPFFVRIPWVSLEGGGGHRIHIDKCIDTKLAMVHGTQVTRVCVTRTLNSQGVAHVGLSLCLNTYISQKGGVAHNSQKRGYGT